MRFLKISPDFVTLKENVQQRRPCPRHFLDTSVKIIALLVLHFTNPPNGSYYVTGTHHVLNYSTFGFSGHQYEHCRLSQQMQVTVMSHHCSTISFCLLPPSFQSVLFIARNIDTGGGRAKKQLNGKKL